MKVKVSKNIGIFGLLLICLSIPILLAKQSTLDELWNYSFAQNIVNGFAPYKDFNMVQTPLSAFVSAVMLKIFGYQLMTMRLLSLVLSAAIFWFFEKLLRRNCGDWRLSVSATAFLAMIYALTFSYDYNYLNLFFILLILFLELKDQDKSEKHQRIINISIGVFASLAFLSKQTTGVAIIFAVIITCLLRKRYAPIKERILGIVLPLVVFTVYLVFNGNLLSFIDYTFSGALKFNNSISYLKFIKSGAINLIAGLGVIAVIITSIVKIIWGHNPDRKNNIELTTLSIAGMIVVFPIASFSHFLAGSLPVLLLLFALLKEKPRKNAYFIFLIAACFLFSFILANYLNPSEGLKYSSLEHFKGIRIDETHEDDVLLVDAFITDERLAGNEVYILDGLAVVYMIPLDIYHKNYDMFLRGNLGSKNPQKLVKELKTKGNSVLLIPQNPDEANWQFPAESYSEVKRQFIKTGQVGDYDVYR